MIGINFVNIFKGHNSFTILIGRNYQIWIRSIRYAHFPTTCTRKVTRFSTSDPKLVMAWQMGDVRVKYAPHCAAELFIRHLRVVLLSAPHVGDGFRVDESEDSGLPILPSDELRAVRFGLEKVADELPKMVALHRCITKENIENKD